MQIHLRLVGFMSKAIIFAFRLQDERHGGLKMKVEC